MTQTSGDDDIVPSAAALGGGGVTETWGTCFPLADRIGIVAITHNNLHRVHGDKGPPGGEPLSPMAD